MCSLHDPALNLDLFPPERDQVRVLRLLLVAGLAINLRLEVESEKKEGILRTQNNLFYYGTVSVTVPYTAYSPYLLPYKKM